MGRLSTGAIVYLVIGVIVANSHGYFAALNTLGHFLSAIIGILLWPLLLLGANLQLTF